VDIASGRFKRYIPVLLLIISILLWYAAYKSHFSGFFWSDSHDYNQIARNIYEGKGFSTSVLRPVSFLNFKSLPHPEITRPPLYPYLLAGFFRLFGLNDFSVVLVNGLFYILLIPMTYLFIREFSKDEFLALIVSACIGLSNAFLKMSIIGSSDIVYTSLVMFFFYIYIKYPEKIFILGLLAGLLWLTRLNAVFLISALVVIDYKPFKFDKENLKRLGFFIIGLFLIILPAIIRNYMVSGSAVSSMNSPMLFTKSYPGFYLWTQVNYISPWKFIINHPVEFYEKFTNLFFNLLGDFRYFFGYGLISVMILGLCVPLKDEVHRRFRKVIALTALLQTIVIASTVSPEARYYMFLVPPVVTFFLIFLKSIRLRYLKSMAYFSIVALIIIFSSIGFWQDGKIINYYKQLGDMVKGATNKDSIIASDMAWGISWYADRRAVWLPYDLDTMDKISKTIPITYVFLSIDLTRPLVPYKDNIWQRLFFYGNSFNAPGLKLVQVFYYGNTPIGILYKVERNQIKQE
jgi:4-amino-4-deoxy-L-arabinose transferase-like glycosyltransferase